MAYSRYTGFREITDRDVLELHCIWLKCRTRGDGMSYTRMTILPFLLLVLSPFVIFDSDYALILCPLCKSNTLWNIFMILGRNV